MEVVTTMDIASESNEPWKAKVSDHELRYYNTALSFITVIVESDQIV